MIIFFQCLNSRLNGLHMLCVSDLIETCFPVATVYICSLNLIIVRMEVIVELHASVIECEDRELELLIADTESRTWHGILTLRKIDDERKYRKRLSPSYEKVVVRERKEKRFQSSHCD